MRLPAILLVLSALSACAGRPETVALAPPPPPALVAPAPPAPTPVNAGLSPAATLWHLRTGLNVAALACRGSDAAGLTAEYNRFLGSRGAALTAAQALYAAEYQATGGAWRARFDGDQTRLYNFWSQSRGRSGLCAVAGEALAAVAAADEAGLPQVAATQLALLDRAFAPPRLEVDMAALTQPAPVAVAVAMR